MNKILVIIDVQNDFIDGCLGNEQTKVIPEKIIEHLKNNDYSKIYCTLDTHEENYLETLEGRNLPVVHCVKGTEGHKLVKSLDDYLKTIDDTPIVYFEKETFGSLSWEEIQTFLDMHKADEIEICGVCTDICVVSNALILRALHPNTRISVIQDCCAGVTPETHQAALTTMQMCQINLK